jgi:hypothetical protein
VYRDQQELLEHKVLKVSKVTKELLDPALKDTRV